MKIWKRVILGVVFSFVAFFTCLGYAALTDQLSITGTISASMPKELFISEIKLVNGSDIASISGLQQITVSGSNGATALYEITVCNNTDKRYVYTGSSANPKDNITVTETDTADGEELGEAKNTTNYVSGANLLHVNSKTADGPTFVTFYVQYTLTADGSVVIDYNFQDFIYKIAYIHQEEERDAWYVHKETTVTIINKELAETLQSEVQIEEKDEKIKFEYWMNAGSTKVEEISKENKDDINLYPKFNPLYTAMFLDRDGNVIDWIFFAPGSLNKVTELAAKIKDEGRIPEVEDLTFAYWEVHETDDRGNTIAEYPLDDLSTKFGQTDIAIYPGYQYKDEDLDVRLESVDKDGDGKTDNWEVVGYKDDQGLKIVRIPAKIKGQEVTTISRDAFSSYDDLHSVVIPGTITTINYQAFTANQGSQYNPKRDTVTLYYEGDPDTWKAAMEAYNDRNNTPITENSLLQSGWDNNMGDGSRVFFLKDGKVDNTKYWELNDDYVWVLHEHAYSYEAAKNCALGENSHYEYGGGFFGWGASLQENKFTDYDGACDCSSCNGATRPDAEYWTMGTTN
jgi:hypothetical protein